MSKLRLPLRLRRPVTDGALHASWQSVAARRSRPARGMWRFALAFGVAALLLVLATRRHATNEPPAPGAVHWRAGATLGARSASAHEVLEIDDGSSFELAAGTRLDTIRNDGRAVQLRLDSGALTLDIRPNGPRVWTVNAGNAVVRIIGTRLSIEMREGFVRVSVEHGRVAVASDTLPDRERTLGAGESVDVPSSSPAIPPSALPDAPPASAEPPVRATPPATSAAPEWKRLAEAKNFDGAYSTLGGAGLSSEVRKTDDVSMLVALADVARLSHHPDAAVAPLERILAIAPRHPNAPLSAFTLGKIEMDELGHPARGAVFFERCIALGAPRSLEEAVYMRWADALARSGDAAGAQRVATRYREKYPHGQYLDGMSRWPAGD
jgi:transmembrane sensor